ncbi:phytoene desaturase family protein [Paenibacillus radicis (ex Gao et al. 2016)]|uniref:Dehydrosqualene desaturase n=1 Tax=Paenibacillus radicis (ex Gao et al. 2016) TaxID=1737354 RepID=A0A917H6G3_9BACL|nr:phytoene desaturase family protein [Paenibacillus radicis (ex Gao et al. 2016)]GGG68883.1 dehydrosqualene desaturase [Paenibacillus radicis (ex Gao et al. 2016)]
MEEIAIVGGGVGALTTALLLSRHGGKVTIYEKSDKLGGRLAFESNGRYQIDQGPTIVLLPEMILGIMEEAGIERSRIPLVECHPLYRIHYADGTVLHKWRDTEKQVEEIERLFPGEGAGYRRYLRDMEGNFKQGKKAFLDRPFLRKKEFYTFRNLSLLTKLKAYTSVRQLARQYFRNERLADAFSLQTLYIGGAPFESPALYSLLPYAEHAFGVWYVKGGYASLVSIMEEELKLRGVAINLNTSVQELVIEGKSCRGVKTDKGITYHDAVVYNGDFPGLAPLLPEDKRPASKTYKPSSGCLLVYLGLKQRWPEAAAHQFFLPESLQKGLQQIFLEDRIPSDPSFYLFNPVAIDESAAPEGESVMYVLIPVPPVGQVNWQEEQQDVVNHVLAEAERRGFPGLRDAISWMRIRTPQDAQADGLYLGGSFGIAPTLGQSAVYRPQIVPYAINRLYAVGASVHPGAGIPIVMQGAKLLADHLLKEESLWTSQPV